MSIERLARLNLSKLYKCCINVEEKTPVIIYDGSMNRLFCGTLQEVICKHEELLYREIHDFEIVSKEVDVVEVYLEDKTTENKREGGNSIG